MRFATFLPALFSAAVIVTLVSLTARADLATEAPAVQEMAPMDDQMRRAKADYEEATRSLTPEQLAELATLEAEFAASMDVDMKIFHRSAEMEHCLTHDGFFKADKNRHVKAFVEWRQGQKDAQEKLWNAHRVARARAGYVSIAILNEYYTYQSKLLRMVGIALARQQMQAGAFKDTDCDLLAKTLAAGE